jgi:hypothetical protein
MGTGRGEDGDAIATAPGISRYPSRLISYTHSDPVGTRVARRDEQARLFAATIGEMRVSDCHANVGDGDDG